VAFDDKMRPVFMISVAAELAEMHPQTLRMYERRGLIRPRRSSKSTRLYSMEDVEKLRRIQQLVAECGLNLAGVERVLEMEEQLAALQRRLDQLQADMDRLAAQAREELEAVHRSYRKELVPLGTPGEVVVVARQRRARTPGSR
jgi:MerR family transcriptional regulator/heat shock protein HspR